MQDELARQTAKVQKILACLFAQITIKGINTTRKPRTVMPTGKPFYMKR